MAKAKIDFTHELNDITKLRQFLLLGNTAERASIATGVELGNVQLFAEGKLNLTNSAALRALTGWACLTDRGNRK